MDPFHFQLVAVWTILIGRRELNIFKRFFTVCYAICSCIYSLGCHHKSRATEEYIKLYIRSSLIYPQCHAVCNGCCTHSVYDWGRFLVYTTRLPSRKKSREIAYIIFTHTLCILALKLIIYQFNLIWIWEILESCFFLSKYSLGRPHRKKKPKRIINKKTIPLCAENIRLWEKKKRVNYTQNGNNFVGIYRKFFFCLKNVFKSDHQIHKITGWIFSSHNYSKCLFIITNGYWHSSSCDENRTCTAVTMEKLDVSQYTNFATFIELSYGVKMQFVIDSKFRCLSWKVNKGVLPFTSDSA